MKKILLWDPRFPDRAPRRLTLADDIASACVRAGVAAAADPVDHAALAAGGALDPASLTSVVVEHGFNKSLARIVVPLSVAVIGVATGLMAATDLAIAGGAPTPTPTPTPTPGDPSGFTLPFGARLGVVGDSIDVGPTRRAMQEALGWSLYIPAGYSKAVSGTEVDDTPDADDYVDVQLPALLALTPKPDAILVGGAENSISHGKTGTSIIAGYGRIFTAIRAAGVKIMVRPKIKNWGESSSDKIASSAAVQAYLLGQQGNDLIVLDPNLDFAMNGAGTGNNDSDTYNGNGHPGYRGSWRYAQVEKVPLAGKITGGPLLPASGVLPSNQNLFAGWNHAGTAGTITSGGSGVLADAWTLTNTSVNAALTKGTVTSGDVAQILTFSGAATTTPGKATLVCSSATPIKAGQIAEWVIEYEMFAADGVSDPKGLSKISVNDVNITTGQSNASVGGHRTSVEQDDLANNEIGRKSVIRTQPQVIGADIANPVMVLSMYFAGDRAIDAVVKIGRVFLRLTPEDVANRTISLDAIAGVTEGTGTGNSITITARRPIGVGTPSVQYALSGAGGNPLSASDFQSGVLPSGTITFADGAVTASVSHQLAGDSTLENDEGFSVTISNPSSGWYLGSTITQTSTVFDDDSGVSYDADAQAYFARMSVAPTTATKGKINTLILALKNGALSSSNLWTKMTGAAGRGFHLFAVETAQAARLGVASAANDLSNAGTGPTFTALAGFTGVDTTNYLLSTAVPPAEEQNDHIHWVYSLTDGQQSTAVYSAGSTSDARDAMITRNATDNLSGRNMSSLGYSSSGTVTTGKGLFAMYRSSATGWSYAQNGVAKGSQTRTSSAMNGGNRRFFAGGGTQQLLAAGSGFSLTLTEQQDLYNALNAYGAAVGAPV